jgi:hypothetical protein
MRILIVVIAIVFGAAGLAFGAYQYGLNANHDPVSDTAATGRNAATSAACSKADIRAVLEGPVHDFNTTVEYLRTNPGSSPDGGTYALTQRAEDVIAALHTLVSDGCLTPGQAQQLEVSYAQQVSGGVAAQVFDRDRTGGW